MLTKSRLAKMIAHCEANQAWLENITYQMTLMPYKQQSTHLAGPIGLLKMFATRSAHECADEAVQSKLDAPYSYIKPSPFVS